VTPDFFAFCTSLQLLEMKAIGSLSEVRHLDAGQTIYRPGDAADTLFIINRGVVDLFEEGDDSSPEQGTAYVRGDILADVEVLTSTPHTHLARCREEVSLRCFHRDKFPELVQRAPAFFRFLSEQFAHRFLQLRNADTTAAVGPNLAGSLSDFDLVTIYQTIVHSSQTGELSILDEDGEVIAAFYFEKGRPRSGQFQHLMGEEALRQFFLLHNPTGTFLFTSARGVTATIKGNSIERHAADMLISALQSRDEWEALRVKLGDGSAVLTRRKSTVDLDALPPDVHETAERIWAATATRQPALWELYPQFSVSEFAIYRAVDELLHSGQIALVRQDAAQKVA
jgi:CRP-like cAMP-binding protein